MQLTWLDLIAGNIGGYVIVWGLISTFKDWKAERTWGSTMILLMLIGLGGTIFISRAAYWFHGVQG